RADAKLHAHFFRHAQHPERLIEHRDDHRAPADAEQAGKNPGDDAGEEDRGCEPRELSQWHLEKHRTLLPARSASLIGSLTALPPHCPSPLLTRRGGVASCGSPWQSKPDRTGCARKPLPVGCVKPAKVSTLDHSWPIADLAYSLPVPGPSGHDGTLWPAEAPRCRSTCRGRAPIDAALGHQYRPRCRSPSSRAPAKDVTMAQPKEAALAP